MTPDGQIISVTACQIYLLVKNNFIAHAIVITKDSKVITHALPLS